MMLILMSVSVFMVVVTDLMEIGQIVISCFFLIMLEIRNIDTWSPRMAAPLLQIYGEVYFRKLWEDWVDTFVEIYNRGGDLCKDDLTKVKCPTLIIHGLKDPMVGLEHAEYLHQNIQNSR